MDQASRNNYNSTVNEIFNTIRLLYYSIDIETKNYLLQRLEEQIGRLLQLFDAALQGSELGNLAVTSVQSSPKIFTRDELLKYDGTNGNPAYVAINGIVYDVTNNPVWAAATHFGLKAGGDYTSEFASCHTNQDILSGLEPVGRLQDEQLL